MNTLCRTIPVDESNNRQPANSKLSMFAYRQTLVIIYAICLAGLCLSCSSDTFLSRMKLTEKVTVLITIPNLPMPISDSAEQSEMYTSGLVILSNESGLQITKSGPAGTTVTFNDISSGIYYIYAVLRNSRNEIVFKSAARAILAPGQNTVVLMFPNAVPVNGGTADDVKLTAGGCVAQWLFNGDTYDSSGSSHDGSWYGVARYIDDRHGRKNGAPQFDGVSSYIRVPSAFNFSKNSWSISLWIRSSDPQQQTATVFNTEPHAGIAIGYNHYEGSFSKKYSVWLSSQANAWDIALNHELSVANPTSWYHLCIVRQAAKYDFYVDGKFESSIASAVNVNDVMASLRFGASSAGHTDHIFNGSVDDVRIYDYPLSVDAIAALAGE